MLKLAFTALHLSAAEEACSASSDDAQEQSAVLLEPKNDMVEFLQRDSFFRVAECFFQDGYHPVFKNLTSFGDCQNTAWCLNWWTQYDIFEKKDDMSSQEAQRQTQYCTDICKNIAECWCTAVQTGQTKAYNWCRSPVNFTQLKTQINRDMPNLVPSLQLFMDHYRAPFEFDCGSLNSTVCASLQSAILSLQSTIRKPKVSLTINWWQ